MLGVTVPDGKPCGELPWRPYAIADGAEYAGIIHNGAKRRCAIVRKGETRPVVSLLPDTDLGALAFDRSSRRMIWGSTDGSVTVCDIPDIRTRLNRLGLGW
jgi:hypothetical protein